MEIIRIPKVSLVDGTGKKIGVYEDNPDWWQRLKQIKNEEDLKKNSQHMLVENESIRQLYSSNNNEINSFTGTGGSKVLLIDEANSHNSSVELKTSTDKESEIRPIIKQPESGKNILLVQK